MADHTPDSIPRSWAEVHAREHVVRYRRSGAGPVIVLLGGADGAARWPTLEDTLSRIGRVLTPEIAPNEPAGRHLDAWLAAFLEGIGASGIAIVVADDSCAAPVLAMALLEPELIRSVVWIAEGVTAGTPLVTSLAGAQRAVPLPMLLLASKLSYGDAEPALIRFLQPTPAGRRS
jgi:hypothetical protein